MDYKPDEKILKEIAEIMEEELSEERKRMLKNMCRIHGLTGENCVPYDIYIKRENKKQAKYFVKGERLNSEMTGGASIDAAMGMIASAHLVLDIPIDDILEYIDRKLSAGEIKAKFI